MTPDVCALKKLTNETTNFGFSPKLPFSDPERND
jgi:hypothetical protein